MYNVTLYKNTGFNAVNIPDSKTTLDLAQHQTFQALDLYQARELSSFNIRANYSDVRDADYLLLENTQDQTDFAFYSIQSAVMSSMDVATLNVTMDYILTAGGVAAMEFTDGLTERHHVAIADDDFGAYAEPDPYLAPAEPMKIETAVPDFEGQVPGPDVDKDKNVTIIESTVDLWELYSTFDSSSMEGVDYTSPDSNVVTVPSIPGVTSSSGVRMTYNTGVDDFYETDMPSAKLYVANPTDYPWDDDYDFPSDLWIPRALALIRALGIESCIIAQYAVPYYMIFDSEFYRQPPAMDSPGDFSICKGSRIQLPVAALPYDRTYTGYNVQNERLFYGNDVSYHIVSIASGNEASFLPEEIYDGATAPIIEMRVDPRPKGCPYFRFRSYRGDVTPEMFFTNSVKGMPWQNVPLVYEGGSGSLLNQYRFNAQQAIRDEDFSYAKQRIFAEQDKADADLVYGMVRDSFNAAMNVFGNTSSQQQGFLTDITINPFAIASNISNNFLNSMQRDLDYKYGNTVRNQAMAHSINAYNAERNSELQNLMITNAVVAPSMNFPISEGIRDFVGNGCLVYRMYYSDNDVRRLDKILNMYGYKHITPITTDLLTNRRKFNYIQAKGVAIKNTDIPKWIRDGVAEQFSAGTRIWHQLPDTRAYTDGTNT